MIFPGGSAINIEHAEIRLQPPPAPIQNLDALQDHPPPSIEHEKIASSELMMMGMMLWMEQGLVLEWLAPKPEKVLDEDESGQKEKGEPAND
jgi:hypothetical protein